jgi:hypothetical protein
MVGIIGLPLIMPTYLITIDGIPRGPNVRLCWQARL